MTVGQGPTALTVGAGGGCLDIFTLIYPFSPLSPSLWEMARYRLKYCLKGPLNPKQLIQCSLSLLITGLEPGYQWSLLRTVSRVIVYPVDVEFSVCYLSHSYYMYPASTPFGQISNVT